VYAVMDTMKTRGWDLNGIANVRVGYGYSQYSHLTTWIHVNRRVPCISV